MPPLLSFSVLKFIYLGSTTVALADVDDFMNAAEKTFGLRGLHRQDDQDHEGEVRRFFRCSLKGYCLERQLKFKQS